MESLNYGSNTIWVMVDLVFFRFVSEILMQYRDCYLDILCTLGSRFRSAKYLHLIKYTKVIIYDENICTYESQSICY
jgi:hypothetical protein